MGQLFIIILVPPGSKDPGGGELKTKIKNKLEWLRVGIVISSTAFILILITLNQSFS